MKNITSGTASIFVPKTISKRKLPKQGVIPNSTLAIPQLIFSTKKMELISAYSMHVAAVLAE